MDSTYQPSLQGKYRVPSPVFLSLIRGLSHQSYPCKKPAVIPQLLVPYPLPVIPSPKPALDNIFLVFLAPQEVGPFSVSPLLLPEFRSHHSHLDHCKTLNLTTVSTSE